MSAQRQPVCCRLIGWDVFSTAFPERGALRTARGRESHRPARLVTASAARFSSRYFHWKVNLCVILLVLVFTVPFYIGYFIVSNIRLREYCGLSCWHAEETRVLEDSGRVELLGHLTFSSYDCLWGISHASS